MTNEAGNKRASSGTQRRGARRRTPFAVAGMTAFAALGVSTAAVAAPLFSPARQPAVQELPAWMAAAHALPTPSEPGPGVERDDASLDAAAPGVGLPASDLAELPALDPFSDGPARGPVTVPAAAVAPQAPPPPSAAPPAPPAPEEPDVAAAAAVPPPAPSAGPPSTTTAAAPRSTTVPPTTLSESTPGETSANETTRSRTTGNETAEIDVPTSQPSTTTTRPTQTTTPSDTGATTAGSSQDDDSEDVSAADVSAADNTSRPTPPKTDAAAPAEPDRPETTRSRPKSAGPSGADAPKNELPRTTVPKTATPRTTALKSTTPRTKASRISDIDTTKNDPSTIAAPRTTPPSSATPRTKASRVSDAESARNVSSRIATSTQGAPPPPITRRLQPGCTYSDGLRTDVRTGAAGSLTGAWASGLAESCEGETVRLLVEKKSGEEVEVSTVAKDGNAEFTLPDPISPADVADLRLVLARH